MLSNTFNKRKILLVTAALVAVLFGVGFSTLLDQQHIALASPAIVGGSNVTDPALYASIPRIEMSWGKNCTGTLIQPNWVITAQHCTFDRQGHSADASMFTIIFQQSVDSTATPTKADTLIRAPNYSPTKGKGRCSLHGNDVALLHLVTAAPGWSKPIALAKPSQQVLWSPGTKVTTAGYGADTVKGTHQIKQLRQAFAIASSVDSSQRLIYGSTPNHTTANGFGMVNSGDSGGPLLAFDEFGNRILIGVTNNNCFSFTGLHLFGHGVKYISDSFWAETSEVRWYMWINRYTAPNTLYPGQALGSERELSSVNSVFQLWMQGDGNLVEYTAGGAAIWSSGTQGHPGSYAIEQSDGNLVIREPNGNLIWSNGMQGYPGTVFQIQSDGNVVAYAPGHRPIWATGSQVTPGPFV